MALTIEQRIAQELGVRDQQVSATVALLDGGSTVPFIARYRKEATGGLDDIQLRALETRLTYLRELEKRREAVIALVAEQGKLTPALEAAFRAAEDKARLEDLYLPYKVKRRTKAAIAREAGLEPLADGLLSDPTQDPETAATAYVDAEKGVADVKAALDGARQILMERWAEDADLAADLRAYVWGKAQLKSQLVEGKAEAGAKFRDYFDAAEAISKIPSHRALALFRGRKEEVLTLSLDLGEPEERGRLNSCEAKIAARAGLRDLGRAADRWLQDTARWTWRVKLSLRVETDLLGRLWDAAEAEAIHVFAENLRALLLAAPAGSRATIGLDPGFRTGVKVAVIDGSGKLAETATIYPHEPQRRWDEALAVIDALVRRFDVGLIAIGNGTASRETDKLVNDLLKKRPELAGKLRKAMVSEAGASVYSASEFASQELPGVDVSLRGAASIARRLQDPLAELVKIDPKSIGVGQYQHDVSELQLSKTLDAVVEDCVNGVGVDLNTASAPLLARVSGLGDALARAVVAFREAQGRFKNRKQLLEVPRLGPKAFEQCAGFLRIREGDNPLDASAVHPEAYPLVERILDKLGRPLESVMGDVKTLRGLKAELFADDHFGAPTVKDIIAELEKPGRDPRPEFRWAEYQEGVETINDLKPGMMLEGVVTNVANFGAFVDIGVHQDGLVHVSALADRFVKDPREVVKPGDLVKVKVMEVDAPRKRISLSMRMGDQPGAKAEAGAGRSGGGGRDAPLSAQQRKAAAPKPEPAGGGALAEAFARAKKR